MKNIFYLLFFTILLISNCETNKNTKIMSKNNFSTIHNNIYTNKAIESILLDEIIDFITYCDSIENLYEPIIKVKIFNIRITKYKSNHYVFMQSDFDYDFKKMIGYTLLDDRMIVCYENESIDGFKFINEKYLLKDKNLRFNEREDGVSIIFENYGRLYKIIDSDSLIFLKQSIRLTLENYFHIYD